MISRRLGRGPQNGVLRTWRSATSRLGNLRYGTLGNLRYGTLASDGFDCIQIRIEELQFGRL
jgi:hypothetical protein